MKLSLVMLFMLMSVFINSASSYSKNIDKTNIKNNTPMANGKIKITVNSRTFTATLSDNNTAKLFKEMLPLTTNMTELNGNEKWHDLPQNIPINPSNPEMIKNGDLMLYGSKTLVLFYQSFSTSYSYTKLGKIDDAKGLATALGCGNVTVTFEL